MVHSFTYIDDVGRALAVLGTDPRGHNRIWHVPTNPALTQTEMLGRLAAAAGAPAPKIAATSKAVLSVLGVFSKDLGEMKKVYDQFDRPFVLDSSAFTHTFGIGATPSTRRCAPRRHGGWRAKPSPKPLTVRRQPPRESAAPSARPEPTTGRSADHGNEIHALVRRHT